MDPFPTSQCQQCVHKRDVKSARSHFLMCTEGTLPKYPQQPVKGCPAFAPHPAAQG